ncbi:hypothetical protein GCM10017784_29020 [Deinococcus indicus]|nr:hypothetical protein GCM10017784_29020 [Deinococcus indicus]
MTELDRDSGEIPFCDGYTVHFDPGVAVELASQSSDSTDVRDGTALPAEQGVQRHGPWNAAALPDAQQPQRHIYILVQGGRITTCGPHWTALQLAQQARQVRLAP